MRRAALTVCLLAVSLLSVHNAPWPGANALVPLAQQAPPQFDPWTTNGPEGGPVNSLTPNPLDPRVMYAGTQRGGVFKTLNGGAVWAASSGGLSNRTTLSMDINAVAVSASGHLYAATNGGVYSSADAGANWTRTSTGLGTLSTRWVAADPSNPAVLYAATNGGIYKSTNSGASWTSSSSGITTQQIQIISVAPGSPATLLAGTNGAGVFRSDNAGLSWTPAGGTANQFVNTIARDHSNPAVVMIGTNSGIFRSTDGGTTWTATNTGLPSDRSIRGLAVDPSDPSRWHAGATNGGVYLSVDAGSSWTQISTLSQGVRALTWADAGSGALFAATGDGVFRQSGTDWTRVNTGLTNTTIVDVAVTNDGTLYGATNTALFLGTNDGRQWVPRTSGIVGTISAIAVSPSNSQVVYVATEQFANFTFTVRVYRTIDGGGSWQERSGGLPASTIRAMAVDPTSADRVFVASSAVYRSDNGGTTWAATAPLGTSSLLGLTIDPDSPGTIYVAAAGLAGVYKSVDGGLSWSGSTSGITNQIVWKVAIDPEQPTDLLAAAQGGIFRSTDGGATWVPSGTGIPSSLAFDVAFDPGETATAYVALAGGSSGTGVGVYRTTDGGASWVEFNTGLTNLITRHVAVGPGPDSSVYAGTEGSGIAVRRRTPVDATPPTVTFAFSTPANAAGWHNQDFTITGIGADPETDVASIVCSSTSYSASGRQQISFLWTIEGVTPFTCTATNGAGLTGSVTFTVRLDKSAPVVQIVTPSATTYDLHQQVLAAFSCADPGSGFTACQSTVGYNSPIDTATAGEKTFTVSVTDTAGNLTSRAVTYIVRQGTPTVTVTGGTFTYDGLPHPASGQVIGVRGEDLGSPSFTYNGSANAPIGVGAYNIVATYPGNADYISVQHSTATIVIARASTTTMVASAPNPSGAGQPVTLNATVTVVAPGGGVPTGTVQFFDGTTLLGNATLASGSASLVTLALPPGTRAVTARYAGDASYGGSVSPAITHEVRDLTASTLTTLTSSPNPSAAGAPVTFTATVAPVSGNGIPSGTVEFFDGPTSIGSAALATVGGQHRAILSTDALAEGQHQIVARYSGDTTFGGSGSVPLTHTVYSGAAPTATTTTLDSTPNPSLVGDAVTFTATVRGSGGGSVPSGDVEFFANEILLARATLVRSGNRGTATFSTATLPRGLYAVTARYMGGSGFAASSSPAAYQCVDCLTENVRPLADAGGDQSVTVGARVQLDGSASHDPDQSGPLTYTWSITSRPRRSVATLSNTSSVRPSFIADLAGTYVVQLVVNDGTTSSAADSVTVIAGTAGIAAPVANAGPDQTVTIDGAVLLDGSASSDPASRPLTYAWLLVARPAGSSTTLTGGTTATPSFFADQTGTYEIELVVSNGSVTSAPDRVVVIANERLNRAPTANAGPDATAALGTTVQLDGSRSTDLDGDLLQFSWTLVAVPEGSAAALSDPTAVRPTFVIDRPGEYEVRLVVSDGRANSTPDTVVVTTTNSAPVADAGTAQTVPVGSTVQLDGSGSNDPDGDSLTYAWSFVSRPASSTATLENATTPMPTFVADAPGSYRVRLIVSDGQVSSAEDTVTVDTTNSAPTADAGIDQTIALGATVALDGSASVDVDGDPLTYEWAIVSRPADSGANLSDPAAPNASFIADRPGEYVVQLRVNDGQIWSAPDLVVITTRNSVAVARAGADQNVVTGTPVQLDGTASSDADGDSLTYAWSFTSRPEGSTAALSDAADPRPTFVPDLPGLYIVQLIVHDGRAPSEADTVSITATTANAAPVANAGVDRTLQVGDRVRLDGRGSSDPDNDPLTFAWSFVSVPDGSAATLSGATTAEPEFTADLPGQYVVRLIVNDGTTDSEPDTVVIRTNAPPVARAGPDQMVQVGSTVQLDGCASFDPDNTAGQFEPCQGLTFTWIFNTKPLTSEATLSNDESPTPTFTADVAGTYVLQLVVNDTLVNSASDTVTITTINRPPVANAGADQTDVLVGATVQLDGSASFDPDAPDAALTYRWELVSRPATSNATLTTPTAVASAFVADRAGTYVVELIVNDGVLDSPVDTVTIRTSNRAPVAIAGEDTTAIVGAPITLTGNGSSDPDADPLTYQWRALSVPAGSGLNALTSSSTNLTFTPDVHGPYVLELVVSDGQTSSPPDTVTVTAVLGGMQLELVGTPLIGLGGSGRLRVTLDAPAPADGTVVTLQSLDPEIVAVAPPVSVAVAAGSRQATFVVNGISAGNAELRAAAPGFNGGALTVAVTANVLTMNPSLNVAYGQTASLPVTLAPDPAPAGGLIVTITSDNAAIIGVDSPTIQIPAGAFSANVTVRGLGLGSATISASHPSFASASSLVTSRGELNILEPSVTFSPGFPQGITVRLESGGVAAAAPAEGISVTLETSDATCVSVVSPLTIPAGLVSATRQLAYAGTASLPCAATITARGTDIVSDTVSVTVQPDPSLTVYGPGGARTTQPVGRDLQASGYFLSLGTGQHGGVTVQLEVSDPSVALLSATGSGSGTPTLQLTIPNGSQSANFVVQAIGAVGASATIRATADRFTPAAPLPMTVAQTVLRLDSLSATTTTLAADIPFVVRVDRVNSTGNDLAFSGQVVRGGTSLSAVVRSSVPTVGTLRTSAGIGAERTVVIAAGSNQSASSVATGGVALDPLAVGTTTISAAIDGVLQGVGGSVAVRVDEPGTELYGVGFGDFNTSATIGAGLQLGQFWVRLGGSEHGGVYVEITSDDPGRVLLSPDATTAGTGTISVFVQNAQRDAPFYIQTVAGTTGSVGITVRTPRFSDAHGTVTVVPIGVRLQSLPAQTTSLAADSPFTVRVDRINSTASDIAFSSQVVRAGTSIVVTVESSDESAGVLTTSAGTSRQQTVTIPGGVNSSAFGVANGGIAFDPIGDGITTVTAAVPSGVTIPPSTQQVLVVGPGIELRGVGFGDFSSSAIIGAGLQHGQFWARLGGANHGGVRLQLTSDQPGRVLLSTDPSTPGTGTVYVDVEDGRTDVTFYIHAVEGTTGTATLTASANRFADAQGTVTVVPSVLRLSGLGTSSTTLSADEPFTVWVDRGNFNGSDVAFSSQVVRAGTTMVAEVTSSLPTVGLVKTSAGASQSQFVTIAAGQRQSPFGLAAGGVVFDPIAAGVTDVTAAIPNVVTTPHGTVRVTVTSPGITLRGVGFGAFASSAVIGAGLQHGVFYAQLEGSAHPGVNVRITSSNPGVVLVSSNVSTAGSAHIDVPVAPGETLAQFYIHGMNGTTGSVNLTASATGFTDATDVVTVVQPVLRLNSLPLETNSLSTDHPFTVAVDRPNSTGTDIAFTNQVVRAGTTMTATVTSSVPAVGTVKTLGGSSGVQTIVIPAGQSQSSFGIGAGGVVFDPQNEGTTDVSATIPGVTTSPAGVVSVRVNAPAIRLFGPGFGPMAGYDEVGAGLQMGPYIAQLDGNGHGGVRVRIESSNPAVMRIAPDANTPGASFIEVDVPDGQTLVTYYLQGMENALGTAEVIVSAGAFSTGRSFVTIVEPAIDITGLSTALTATGASNPFSVRVGITDVSRQSVRLEQAIRAGGTAVLVTVTTSNVLAAQLVTASGGGESWTIPITAGNSRSAPSAIELDPLEPGTTVVSATHSSAIVTSAAAVVVVINP